jgi:hypothetical protein
MMSDRYIHAICVLLALALVPTLIHSYSSNPPAASGLTTAIPMVLAGAPSVQSDRSATWGKRRFDSDDWIERQYSDPKGGVPLRLTVVRSYDAKSVYHHPELAVAYGTSFVGQETRRFASHPEIPVHVLKAEYGVHAAGLYVLHYETRFVDDPLAFQIRTAADLLVSRRKPMTLFFVLDPEAPPSESVEQSPAATLLFHAIDAFLGQPAS